MFPLPLPSHLSHLRVIGHPTENVETGYAMNVSNPILSPLAPGAGSRLRTASVCLLVIAASLSIHAFVPNHATPARRPSARAIVQRAPAARHTAARLAVIHRFQSQHHTRALLQSPIPSVSNAPVPAFSRRIFVEGTTPPAEEALTVHLQGLMVPYALPRPESPALRNASASPSNRQRAP